jgi:DivIVA domain-containing protein
VPLDRQSIEKKDFPVGRRGYDPDAVDAHLAVLADEIADFKRSARRRSDTLASSASEQVRAIVEAAETSASDIQHEAESDAKEIRDEANSEAVATREQAADKARDYVGKVSESTATMLERLDAMEGELSGLIDSLRTGANRLDADLHLLESNLADLGDAVTPRQQFEAEPDSAPALAAGTDSAFETEGTTEADGALETEESFVTVTSEETMGSEEEPAGATAAEAELDDSETFETATQAEGADDSEGARLIALNMALNGTPREETAKYLSENFQLSDRDALLDEVYASVDG